MVKSIKESDTNYARHVFDLIAYKRIKIKNRLKR